MAQVSCATWDAFVEVNNLYESGKLKAQKFSSGDVAKGTLALKQWHIKPLVSLPDESKLYLLKKVRKRYCSKKKKGRGCFGSLMSSGLNTNFLGQLLAVKAKLKTLTRKLVLIVLALIIL